MSKLYEDLNYPSWYRDYIQPHAEETTQAHYWLSQSRAGSDDTVETVRIVFKKPVSISNVSVKALRQNCYVEFYYTDRRNQKLPLVSKSYQQINRTLSSPTSSADPSDEASWATISEDTYPIVAKKFEIAIRRTGSNSEAYSVGIKDLEIKRTLYIQDDTMLPLGDETDALGNYVTKTVKNWDAVKAIDEDAFSFWKSEPAPDKNAVVDFYLDVKSEEGEGQLIDRLWLDPVYSGQRMNIYYSADDTIGTRRLKSVVYPPEASQDVVWRDQQGLRFLPGGVQQYDLKSLSLDATKNFWVGGTWRPEYNSDDDSIVASQVLFQDTKSLSLTFLFNPGGSNFYLIGRGTDGQNRQLVSPQINFLKNSEVIWSFYYIEPTNETPNGTWGFVVQDLNGLFSQTVESTDLELDVDTSGSFSIDLEGYIPTYIIKQSNFRSDRQQWLSSTEVYLTPDPVIEDSQNRLPSTSLDNAMFGGDFRQQELPFGGLDDLFFEQKVWSPIWRDWTVQRSFYFFPRPVYAKYLKIELTDLTEEPYPIYEAGIEVKYKVFPVSVTRADEKRTTEVWTNVDYYDTQGNVIGYYDARAQTVDIITSYSMQVGSGSVTSSIPKQVSMPIEMSLRSEGTGFYDMMRATSLTNTGSGRTRNTAVELTNYRKTPNWYEGFPSPFALDWDRLLKNNPSLFGQKPWVDDSGSVTLPTVPQPNEGRYMLPGGEVSVPATYNQLVTTKASVTTRLLKTFTHSRFTTNSIHRYKIKTATRTEQTGFFAGLRDVKVFRVDYRKAVDTETYFVERYNPDDFEVSSNIEFYSNTGASMIQRWGGFNGSVQYPADQGSIGNFMGSTHPVKRGDILEFEMWIRADKPGSRFYAEVRDQDARHLSAKGNRWVSIVGNASNQSYPISDWEVPTTWTRVVSQVPIDTDDVKTVRFSTFYFNHNNGTTRDAKISFALLSLSVVNRDGLNLIENGDLSAGALGWPRSPVLNTDQPQDNDDSGILETEVFESMSFWQRLELDATCRPPRELFEDTLDYEPLNEDDVQGGSWEDPRAKWSDAIVAWDADHPFIGVSVSLPSLFSGKVSIKITRPEGFGFAGLKTTPFALNMNQRVRVKAELYKLRASKNDVVLQLYDTVANKIIYTDKVEATTGRWNQVYTNFFIPKTNYSSVVARFVVRGSEHEEIYIAGFAPEVTTIVFEASNNGGNTWFDVTNIVNRDAFYMFPEPGREFKLRVTMSDKNDHFFGFEASPKYLQGIKE